MKVLLTNPSYKYPLNSSYEKYFIRSGSRWPHSGVKKKGSLPHYLPFPFFLAYTASLLQKDDNEVSVLDGIALDYDDNQLFDKVSAIKPEIILLETTTPTINHDLFIAKKIKDNTSAKIILTGSHSTVFAKEIIADSDFVDFILKGEYELSCAELIHNLKEKRDLKDIGGLVYRGDSGQVIETERTNLQDDLDLLPFPERRFFPSNQINDVKRYWDGFCQYWPALQMQATRGCPYKCYFCLWNEVMYTSKKYRKFSPQRVVEEMKYLVAEFGAKEIYFDDDDFTIDKQYVSEICGLIIKNNLRIRWSCMGDAINPDNDLLKLMKEAGCIGMKFGVESFSAKVSSLIGKKVVFEKAKEIVRCCSRYGIKSHATFGVGFLDEDESTLNENLGLMRKLSVDTIQVSIATPFPGTRFYEHTDSKGYIKFEDWEDFDGKKKQVLNYQHIDEKCLKSYRDKFLRFWMLSRLVDFSWQFRQMIYLIRYIRGQGLKRFILQIINIIEDELGQLFIKTKDE